MTENPHFYACIMAGGSGERFWPMSRQRTPKQLTKLFGDTTLIEDTVRRLDGVVRRENIFVLTNQVQLAATRAALPMLRPGQIVAEPAKRDTAPAAALAVALVRSRDPRGVMALLSSDALIHDGPRCGQQMADALYEALTMPEEQRKRLLAGAAEQVRAHDVGAWLRAQLSDLGVLDGTLHGLSAASER